MKRLLLLLFVLLACSDDTRRYTFCANGPADSGDIEVWIGDGDITCWNDGVPYSSRAMSATETPETACLFCEVGQVQGE